MELRDLTSSLLGLVLHWSSVSLLCALLEWFMLSGYHCVLEVRNVLALVIFSLILQGVETKILSLRENLNFRLYSTIETQGLKLY